VGLDDPAHDVETDPRPVRVAGVGKADERLERALGGISRDPRTVIADLEDDLAVAGPRVQVERRAGRRELLGVREEVVEDLHDPALIDPDEGGAGIRLGVDVEAIREMRERVAHVVEQLIDPLIRGRRVHVEAELVEMRRALDQVAQVLRLLEDRSQRTPLRLVVELALAEREPARERSDRCDRMQELVTEHPEELGLRPGECFQLVDTTPLELVRGLELLPTLALTGKGPADLVEERQQQQHRHRQSQRVSAGDPVAEGCRHQHVVDVTERCEHQHAGEPRAAPPVE
jgi:hypothetical protein